MAGSRFEGMARADSQAMVELEDISRQATQVHRSARLFDASDRRPD